MMVYGPLFFFGRFNHYGSGSKKVPLQDVLSYALEFAQSKPGLSTSKDVDMQSPKSSNDMNADMGRQELRFVIVDLNETNTNRCLEYRSTLQSAHQIFFYQHSFSNTLVQTRKSFLAHLS